MSRRSSKRGSTEKPPRVEFSEQSAVLSTSSADEDSPRGGQPSPVGGHGDGVPNYGAIGEQSLESQRDLPDDDPHSALIGEKSKRKVGFRFLDVHHDINAMIVLKSVKNQMLG